MQIVTGFAEDNNCLAGITKPDPIPWLKERLEHTETPFTSKSLNRRLLPDVHLPEVKSVIVIGVPNTGACGEVSPLLATPGELCTGLISCMALSHDYHQTVRGLLSELIRRIQPLKYRIAVDGGGLVEREWAVKAGLGFWGKNCCVISPFKGSFFNIGLLLTDFEISDTPASISHSCGTCTKCIDVCPGKAITPHRLDYTKCVSYITQKDGSLSSDDELIMGRHVYGCDICQRVCPYNNGIMPEFPDVSLQSIINMTEDEFNRTCASTVMGWKGLGILKRNAQSVFKTVYNRG